MTLAERMVYYNVPGVSIAVINNDQIEWAKGYGVLEADPDPIPYRKLSSASLARGINQAVNDLEIRKKSTNVGKCIQTENGVYNAMRVIGGPNNV